MQVFHFGSWANAIITIMLIGSISLISSRNALLIFYDLSMFENVAFPWPEIVLSEGKGNT